MERRTTLMVSDALLSEARKVLGTTGIKDTVDKALAEVVAASRRRRLVELLRSGEAFDFAGAAIDRTKHWRTPSS